MLTGRVISFESAHYVAAVLMMLLICLKKNLSRIVFNQTPFDNGKAYTYIHVDGLLEWTFRFILIIAVIPSYYDLSPNFLILQALLLPLSKVWIPKLSMRAPNLDIYRLLYPITIFGSILWSLSWSMVRIHFAFFHVSI